MKVERQRRAKRNKKNLPMIGSEPPEQDDCLGLAQQ